MSKLGTRYKLVATLLFIGMKPRQIGTITGYSATHIRNMSKTKEVQALMEEYRESQETAILPQLHMAGLDAVSYLQKAVSADRPVDKIGIDAAKYLLDKVLDLESTPASGAGDESEPASDESIQDLMELMQQNTNRSPAKYREA